MRRIVMWISRPFWQATSPIRRAFLSRFDGRVVELVAGTVNARMMPQLIDALANCIHRLERIEESIGKVDRAATNMAEEVDLVLNGLSREIFRLQAQVEILQRTLNEDALAIGNGLSIVAESAEEAPSRLATSAPERSRAG